MDYSNSGPVSVSMMATKSIVGLCGQATKVTSGDFFSLIMVTLLQPSATREV